MRTYVAHGRRHYLCGGEAPILVEMLELLEDRRDIRIYRQPRNTCHYWWMFGELYTDVGAPTELEVFTF